MSGPDIAITREQLIAMATTHPNVAARRSACHALFSMGMLMGAMDMARADAKMAAIANAAQATVASAIEKAQAAAGGAA